MNATRSIAELLQDAVALHQAGRLDEAERVYTAILSRDRRNADALNLSGAIAHARGRHAEALVLFDKALAVNPAMAMAHFNRANALETLARTDDAAAAYRKSIELRPDFAGAHLNLGALLHGSGALSEAAAVFRTMAKTFPQEPAAHYNLGRTLIDAGDRAGGEAALREVLNLAPTHVDALVCLARSHAESGRLTEAIAQMTRAVAAAPDVAQYHSVLGNWQAQLARFDDALRVHEQACERAPGDAKVLTNFGAALLQAGRAQDAESVLRRAIAADGLFADAHLNLALVLDELGRTKDGINAIEMALSLDRNRAAAYQALYGLLSNLGVNVSATLALDAAARLAPEDPMVAFSQALAWLAAGDLARGWEKFETRFALSLDPRYHHKGVTPRAAPPPTWAGEDLRGKSILVWTEQGVGDEILFASMLPELIARAGQVVLECSARMAPVFSRAFPAVQMRTHGSPPIVTDVQSAIGSLGRYLRPDFSAFVPRARFLKPDAARVAATRQRYGRRPLVGLSWRSTAARVGRRKSIDVNGLAPVLKIPGARFVSLQYGATTEELRALSDLAGFEIIHDSSVDPLTDMEGFLAQVGVLDLVISVSNTTVHAAGALGVPTWVLLPIGTGSLWYWFRGRDDSPWYPSVRLFRQDQFSADAEWWDAPMKRLAPAFAKWAKEQT